MRVHRAARNRTFLLATAAMLTALTLTALTLTALTLTAPVLPAGAASGRAVSMAVSVGLDPDRSLPETEWPISVWVRSDTGSEVRRGEVRLSVTASRAVKVVATNGWTCSRSVSGKSLSCVNRIVWRTSEARQVLLRADRPVTVKASIARTPGVKSDLVVNAKPSEETFVDAVVEWPGLWEWTATHRGTGRVFRAPSPMAIAVRFDEACATWGFSLGGKAKGSHNDGRWTANWQDGYGRGTWELTLSHDGTFSGVQTVIAANGRPAETYDIVGKRSGSPAALNCTDVTLAA